MFADLAFASGAQPPDRPGQCRPLIGRERHRRLDATERGEGALTLGNGIARKVARMNVTG